MRLLSGWNVTWVTRWWMSVDYQIRRSRRRSLELRLYPDRRVEVRAPLRATDAEIAAFVVSKSSWLNQRLQAMPAYAVAAPLQFRDGEQHLFLGHRHVLQLASAPRPVVQLDADMLHVSVPQPDDAKTVSMHLARWYRQQAEECFTRLLDQHFPYFAARGHQRPVLRIRRMKSRWGSLSSRGYINLNLELIKTPLSCVEYVVVHELCHLEHMNHGPGFRALLNECLPDWQLRRRQLNLSPLI
jgi:predicted metal-dependent hydrolase